MTTLEREQGAEGNEGIVHCQPAVLANRRQRYVNGYPNRPLLIETLIPNFALFVGFAQMRNWLSLRFRDAPAGAISLLFIVFGVMLLPLAASFGGTGPSIRRVFSVLFFLFPPAILSAVYSLFFEKSKLYGGLDVLLASIVLLAQPLAWYWLSLYVPTACVFTIFCIVVWFLKRFLHS